jgi:hypothetical protein
VLIKISSGDIKKTFLTKSSDFIDLFNSNILSGYFQECAPPQGALVSITLTSPGKEDVMLSGMAIMQSLRKAFPKYSPSSVFINSVVSKDSAFIAEIEFSNFSSFFKGAF